jgi:hypothetical protein
MRCSYYPQSLVQIRGANREIRSWIWRSLPASSVHPELPRFHRSNRCALFVGFASAELLNPCVFELCCCWTVLGQFEVVLLGFV